MSSACPCGSGRKLEACCGLYLAGAPAPDAEALMRSRYSAYVLGRHDYLLATWHASTRPATLGGTSLHWIGLQIVRTSVASAQEAGVEFVASYADKGKGRGLHEASRFLREGGQWFYVDGDCRVDDVGRNDACPCGSGKKFKRCCALNT